ncbi:hypothetical protein P4908_04780 [Pantoea ananatis]|uniref:hypothetical protein n=1 Tax=Pantoea ananas TaxID=553 RepID=UPI0023F7DF0D|nr:hypothetical protein [Pantoea ananatis]MDF7789562.1 hypothetical protein [Pantoea ananatis]
MNINPQDYIFLNISRHGNIQVKNAVYVDGRVEQTFYENDMLLPKIPLTGKMIAKVRAMFLIEKDLRNILSWIGLSKRIFSEPTLLDSFGEGDEYRNIFLKSLLISIVTSYMKCFNTTKDRSFSLDDAQVPKEFKQIHLKVKEIRNNFAAHKGAFIHDNCSFSLVVSGLKENPTLEIMPHLIHPNGIRSSKELDDLFSLCKYLHTYVYDKSEDALNQIMEKGIHPHSLDYWLERDGINTNVDFFNKHKK